jgi:hypothetical protein
MHSIPIVSAATLHSAAMITNGAASGIGSCPPPALWVQRRITGFAKIAIAGRQRTFITSRSCGTFRNCGWLKQTVEVSAVNVILLGPQKVNE